MCQEDVAHTNTRPRDHKPGLLVQGKLLGPLFPVVDAKLPTAWSAEIQILIGQAAFSPPVFTFGESVFTAALGFLIIEEEPDVIFHSSTPSTFWTCCLP